MRSAVEVRFEEIKKNRHVVVIDQETGEEQAYLIPYGSRLSVKEGDVIEAGDLHHRRLGQPARRAGHQGRARLSRIT